MRQTPDTPPPAVWLMTGATGRIGRMLVRHWTARPVPGVRIVPLARGPAPPGTRPWGPFAGPLPPGARGQACVIALAGVTEASGGDPGLNRDLAEATLQAAQQAQVPRVLLASSAAVYGPPHDLRPWSEDDPPAPVTAYGRAKLAMEAACAPWRERGIEVCCLRIGNVAGADALLSRWREAGAATPLRIDRFADRAGPVRSYIGPGTLARVLAGLAAHPGPLPRVLNLAAPCPVDMADLAAVAGLPWVWTPAPETAVPRVTLDTARLNALCPSGPSDSAPAEMVRQWLDLRDPP